MRHTFTETVDSRSEETECLGLAWTLSTVEHAKRGASCGSQFFSNIPPPNFFPPSSSQQPLRNLHPSILVIRSLIPSYSSISSRNSARRKPNQKQETNLEMFVRCSYCAESDLPVTPCSCATVMYPNHVSVFCCVLLPCQLDHRAFGV